MKTFVYLFALCVLIETCGAVLIHSQSKKFDDVYIRHLAGRPKRSTDQTQGEGRFTFPERMSFSFEIRAKKIRLDLKLNRKQLQHVQILTVMASGISKVPRKNAERDYAFYQITNDRTPAAVKVRCPGYSYPCHIEGSFEFEGQQYEVEPNHNKLSMSTKVPHKLYTLEKTDTGNYGEDAVNIAIENGVIAKNSNGNRAQNSRTRQKRQTTTAVENVIELEMVIDSEIYRFWTNLLGLSAADTLDAIAEYYEGIANIMDLRYEYLDSDLHNIDLVPLEITIVTEDSGNPWITDNRGPGDTVDSDRALSGFRDWVIDNLDSLSQFDAIMSFTGKDLAVFNSTGQIVPNGENNLGLAFTFTVNNEIVSALCGTGPILAASIVEDRSSGDVGRTAVHELTHNMGVQHDDNLGCNPNDHFIMAASRRTSNVDATTASNPWRFSECSRTVIETTLNALVQSSGTSCLQQDTFDEAEYQALLNEPFLGELLSIDEQCRRRIDPNSERCIIPSLGRAEEDICFEGVLCTIPGTSSCRSLDVEIGSPCGDGKYCFRGVCVLKPTTTTSTTTPTTTTTTPATTTTTTTTPSTTTTTTTPTITTTTPTTTTPTTTTTTPTTTTTTTPTTTTTTTPTTTTTTPTTTTTTPTTTTTTPTTTTTTPTTTTTTPTTTTTTPTTTTTTPTTTTTTPTTTTTTPTTTTTTPTTTTTSPTTTTTSPTTTTATPTTTTTTSPTTTTTTPTTTTTTPTTTTTTPTTTTTTTPTTTTSTTTPSTTSSTTTQSTTTAAARDARCASRLCNFILFVYNYYGYHFSYGKWFNVANCLSC